MGYTLTLNNAASQAEGSTGGAAAASFSFTLTRQAGDVGIANSYRIYNAGDFSVDASDFTANNQVITWAGGALTTTFTVTAALDSNIEPNENFFLYIYASNDETGPVILQSPTITLTNDDVTPTFTSSATFNAAENQLAVGTVAATATGGGTVSYAIVLGGDDPKFLIDATTGVLTFDTTKNYESPDDIGTDRVYNFTVRATAGGRDTDQAVTVNLTNVNEAITNTTAATATVNENTTAVLTASRTDLDTAGGGTDPATWSIVGGADAAKFTMNATTGALAFASAPNFENKTDVGTDNVYDVTIRATDSGGLTSDKAIAVTVAAVDENPVISSNGGGDLAIFHVPENTAITTTLTTVVATDQDAGAAAIVYTKGGLDAAQFTINATTGVLTFAASPNYEAPADSNGDNLYQVDVIATSDVGQTDTQSLYIIVDNVIEPGVPSDVQGTPGTTPTPSNPSVGTAGDDNMPGTAGDDARSGGAGNDTIDGGAGNDVLDGDAGDDRVTGGLDNDFIRGLDGNDTVSGDDGNDTVNGNIGNDVVFGGAGADSVFGGQDQDTVDGGDGDDPYVNGNMGNDIVHAGSGNDSVYGGKDNDSVYGDDGDDRVSGDLGNDNLFGGAGPDRFAFQQGFGNDWVIDFNFSEGDRILLTSGTTYTVANYSGQAVITLSDGSTLGIAGTNTFSAFNSGWVVFG